MKALSSRGQFVYMFAHDYRRLFSSGSQPLVSGQRERKKETLRYDYHLPKLCSPGQIKWNHTHGTERRDRPSFAQQLPRSCFKESPRTERMNTGSRRSAEELIPAQWSFDIGPHHQSPVRLWPGGTAVVATLESRSLPDGDIYSPPAAAVFGLEPSHFKVPQITGLLSKTRNKKPGARTKNPSSYSRSCSPFIQVLRRSKSHDDTFWKNTLLTGMCITLRWWSNLTEGKLIKRTDQVVNRGRQKAWTVYKPIKFTAHPYIFFPSGNSMYVFKQCLVTAWNTLNVNFRLAFKRRKDKCKIHLGDFRLLHVLRLYCINSQV